MVEELEIRGTRVRIDTDTNLRDIAIIIRQDWCRPTKHSEGYIESMERMELVRGEYSRLSEISIIRNFLRESGLWSTENARKVKRVLRVKGGVR